MTDYTSPEWTRSAVLTIDVPREFSLPGGTFCIPGTAELIPAMARLTAAYRSARLPIIHIVRLYSKDGSNVDLCRRAQIESGLKMALPHSYGAQIVSELLPSDSIRLAPTHLLQGHGQKIGPKEWIMYKPRWGAFYKTGLEEHLRRLDVTTTVICGCNFPNCPRTTLYEASERDFRIVFVSDAVSGVYEKGVEEMKAIGVSIMTTDECVQAVRASCQSKMSA